MKTAALLAAVAVVVLLSGCTSQPGTGAPGQYSLLEKPVNELAYGDEVMIGGSVYTFREMQRPGEGYARLIMVDSGGVMVEVTVVDYASVYVRMPLQAGQVAPPPSPLPVEIPVPVPYDYGYSPQAPPAAPVPEAPNATQPSGPSPPASNATNATTPTPPPTPATPVCGNGVIEGAEQCEPPSTAACDANCMIVIQPPYPSHCSSGSWDGDESDVDCGGSCADCLSWPAYYSGCWENPDCSSGNCDLSAATPLPGIDPNTGAVYMTMQDLRQLSGQSWIIKYSGICR